MNSERWRKVSELFHAALACTPSERPAFLTNIREVELRGEVESLIRSHEEPGSFIDAPAYRAFGSFLSDQSALLPGTTISSYKIISLLGKGGMGEVYLAEDSKLGRKVALKVLPSAVTRDQDRVRRFVREARAVSSLNHPNILTVFDIEEVDDIRIIVTEYIEGQTLRQRMQTSRLKHSEALDIAMQIAGALAAAHEAGIVHRDIKPENVMLRVDRQAKVLDFGLAKLSEEGTAQAEEPSQAFTALKTDTGAIVGTTHYMSPEQARGLPVDARTDIWSLGIVLYEIVAGRLPFEGATSSDVLVSLLEREPVSLIRHSPGVPTELQRIITKALRKDRDERYQGVKDMLLDLKALREGLEFEARLEQDRPTTSTGRARTRLVNRERFRWILIVLFFLTTITVAAVYFRRERPHPSMIRFVVPPPENGTFPFIDGPYSVAVSPDGRNLALVVGGEGVSGLWVRAIDTAAPHRLAGTEGARSPFWSPDGRFIGFFSGGKLKKVEATGGPPQTLCDASSPLGAGSWSREGTILIADESEGISTFSEGGAGVVQILKPDPTRQEVRFLWPDLLPDGHHFLFFSRNAEKRNEILVGSIDSKETKLVMQADSRAEYASPGYLLFVTEGTLMAQPFDASALRLTGEQFPIAEQLRYFMPTGGADFSVSEGGVLAYQAGQNLRRLVWLNREGLEGGSVGEPAEFVTHRLSPDGQRVAVDIKDPRLGTTDVWIYDLSHATKTRFTSEPEMENFPIWAPDGGRIVFSASGNGHPPYLRLKALDDEGSGAPIVQPSKSVQFPQDWVQTPEGQFILYTDEHLMILPMSGERKTRPFLIPGGGSGARFSPDGRWVAYQSFETGTGEVHVRPFQGPGRKWVVSTGGGFSPRWRRDGKELFYLTPGGNLMAVPTKIGVSFEAGVPTRLFHFDGRGYDVTADGQRFLFNDRGTALPITVVMNWTADAKR